MTITINHEIVLGCLIFFGISWFFTYLFIKANTFFKICVFIVSFSVFIPLEELDNPLVTIASFLGVLTACSGGIANVFSTIKYTVIDVFYWLKDTVIRITHLFSTLLSGIIQAIIFVISTTKRLTTSRNKQSSESSNNKGNRGRNNKNNRHYKEQQQKAKEQFKQAREEAERREKQANQDNRSFEEIIGVNENYTTNDLKTAYKRSASNYHPDRYAHMSESFRLEAEQEFKRIQQAYKALNEKIR